jgi:PhzF family phenazine biosynthesis protein
MALPLLQIDAFTDMPFRGNPAAVCLLDAPRDAAWMQHVAAEMNLAETAFLVPNGAEGHGARFGLRWFTPVTEVPLCGHATLASAHALWSTGRVPASSPITFDTLSGALAARPADGAITIDLPARHATETAVPDVVSKAIGATAVWTGSAGKGPSNVDYIIECASEAEVRAIRPDFSALRGVPCGVIVTAPAGTPGADVASRYFASYYGIDEDPVTGSAHCVIATHWARKLGRSTFVARQVSAREGILRIRLEGDRVYLTGHAVTVLQGELVV